jgi:hypothetical protein
VFAHHPFIGTEKRQTADDVYFQQMVTRLNDAGVDLVLMGHSHTYSWTYPIVGFSDANQDGILELSEVQWETDGDRVYTKGSGLIQVVSGAGGGSLRNPPYEEPIFAQAYSLAETTGPLEYGLAHIRVTPHELVVSYVSAETGQIVGDTNHNGWADVDEIHFGQFRVVNPAIPSGDVNQDNRVNADDIDAVFAMAREGMYAASHDLDRDQRVTRIDGMLLVENYLGSVPGDANLDGLFNSRDFVSVFQAGEYEDAIPLNSGWADGDWTGDGEFNSRDLVLAFQQGDYLVA